MTERLYYKDPALLSFEGTIIEARQFNGKHLTVLDKTAFYPTSGGQPHDNGLLNSVAIFDVTESDGNIQHISDSAVGTIGDRVKGEVDSGRRKHFRQLHTAQHILSSVFIELYDFQTVSVHLGEDYGAIELKQPSLEDDQLLQAEQLSNEYILQSLPVEIIFAEEQEAQKLPLRKKPSRQGTIRIIKIGEIDYSACGGTHCSNSSEIGLIKIINVEKQRNNILINFLAGTGAKKDYDKRFEVTDRLSKQLTCAVDELKLRYDKIIEENKQYRQQLVQLQKELLPIKIKEAAAASENSNGINYVCMEENSMDSKLAANFATSLADNIGGIALIQLEERIIIGVCETIDIEAKDIARRFSSELNLRGGGGKTMAQLGGTLKGQLNKYREVLVKILNER